MYCRECWWVCINLRSCGDKLFIFANLKEGEGLNEIIDFIVHKGMLGS